MIKVVVNTLEDGLFYGYKYEKSFMYDPSDYHSFMSFLSMFLFDFKDISIVNDLKTNDYYEI